MGYLGERTPKTSSHLESKSSKIMIEDGEHAVLPCASSEEYQIENDNILCA